MLWYVRTQAWARVNGFSGVLTLSYTVATGASLGVFASPISSQSRGNEQAVQLSFTRMHLSWTVLNRVQDMAQATGLEELEQGECTWRYCFRGLKFEMPQLSPLLLKLRSLCSTSQSSGSRGSAYAKDWVPS
jgi:hypothetical protein